MKNKNAVTASHDLAAAKRGANGANTNSNRSQRSESAHPRPLSAHEKQKIAMEEKVAFSRLDDPVLDVVDASNQLSEMNRTRMQRWNKGAHKAPRPRGATAELLKAAQVASSGESYSTLDAASPVEKALIYGAGAGLTLAALPEAAAGAAISFTAAAFESLGYASMASAGIPVTESMLATEAATAAGGATLVGGASVARRAYNSAARFFEKGASEAGRFAQTGSGINSGGADKIYDAIRISTTDIELIAKNTGIKASNIEKVKNHLFHNEHLLDRYVDYGVPAKMGRFDSDISIANTWKRLESGNFLHEDIQLLRHETAEAWYMRRNGPGYSAAHKAADKRYPAPHLDEKITSTYSNGF